MLRILGKTFKTDSRLVLGLGSAFLQGSIVRHHNHCRYLICKLKRVIAKYHEGSLIPLLGGVDGVARRGGPVGFDSQKNLLESIVLYLRNHPPLKRTPPKEGNFAVSISCALALLFAFPGIAFAEDIEYGPVAATPTSTPAPVKEKASTEIKGSTEYNKGCELFGIAKLQASKGNIAGEKQLLKEAQKHFEAALTENPKLVEAQSNIAFIALTLREYRRSIGLFEQALKLNPHHVNSLNGLATTYALTGNVEKSIQTFDVLLKLTPGNSEFFFNKGSVLQKAGRFPEAKHAYEEAIKVNPKNQSALFNLGTLMENQGNLTMAKTYYERARDIEIGNTAGLESLRRLDAINATLNKGK